MESFLFQCEANSTDETIEQDRIHLDGYHDKDLANCKTPVCQMNENVHHVKVRKTPVTGRVHAKMLIMSILCFPFFISLSPTRNLSNQVLYLLP